MKKRIITVFMILVMIILGTSACFADNGASAGSSSDSLPAQSSTLSAGQNTPPAPAAPAEPSAPAEPVTPTEPPAPAEPVTPAEPPAPAEPVTPAEPPAPAEPVTPTEPPAPAEPVTPAEPPAPAEPGSDPVYTVTPDTEVIPGYVYHEKVPILMYHEVNDLLANDLYLSVADFISHLDYFEQQGITPISMQQLHDHWINKAPIPEKPIVLTFDDGYRSMYTTVYPLLKERGWSGTFYCITNARWSRNFVSSDMIAEMAANGMELGSHSTAHVELDARSGDELSGMLVDSKDVLSSITGKEIITLAYPSGKYNNETITTADDAGYICAVTTRYGFAEESQGMFALKRFGVYKDFGTAWLKKILKPLDY